MNTVIPPLQDFLRALAKEREIFHSEADFQHAVAWDLHRSLPKASVTLERPYRTGMVTLHLDMLVRTVDAALAIELKYKTAKFEHVHSSEDYALASQSAQDTGRYDFIKDIWRLEEITQAIPNCRGWAILLTNDSSYWRAGKRTGTNDAEFRLPEGGLLQGTRGWNPKASAGGIKDREKPIALRSEYRLEWADFSRPSAQRNGHFRYLGIEVRSDGYHVLERTGQQRRCACCWLPSSLCPSAAAQREPYGLPSVKCFVLSFFAC